MSPEEWAEVLRAGWDAIPGKSESAANALALALRAMELKCAEIAGRSR
jgi:ABC-type amino acid transport system permease subunit